IISLATASAGGGDSIAPSARPQIKARLNPTQRERTAPSLWCSGPVVPERPLRLLRHHEMCTAVLLPARLVMIGTKGVLLAPAHRTQPILGHAERNQKLARRVRSPLAQSQVVFERTSFVAVTFDRHPDLGVRAEKLSIARQRLPGVRAQIGTIEIEKGIADVLREQLLERGARSRLRSRRRPYSDAHTIRGIATRPGGRDGVGGRSGRADGR